jgi:AcrR family transcriptional regulator
VDLLRRIGELKRAGHSPSDIRRAPQKDIEQARETTAGLAVSEGERIRGAIIDLATEEFMTKGYRAPRVMDIIQKLEMNPHIFYRHFPSKLELLVECFKAATPPPGPRVDRTGPWATLELTCCMVWLWTRAGANSARCSRSPMRSEGIEPRTFEDFVDAWGKITENVVRDFVNSRGTESSPSGVHDELLAYGLLGAYRYATVRASWDEKYESADLLRAHLFVFLCLLAGIAGEIDTYCRVARYEELIRELTAGKPALPTALEI